MNPSKPKKATKAKKDTPAKTAAKKVKRTYLYACGRRKCAVARVRYYKKGEGEIIINDKEMKEHLPSKEMQMIVVAPLEALKHEGKWKITIKVTGGGKRSQVDAIRLGVARVLVVLDAENKKELKAYKYLTRDPRVKERKKYGLKGARRAPQWSKR